MVSLILSFAALGLASSRPPVINGFPSGNSSAAPSARDYNLSSIDIRQAYLQSLLDPNVPQYMRPPPDVFPFDQHGNPLVCRLRRSLYGLKQAGREWAALFSSFLITWGMTRSTINPCLYVFQAAESILWVCVYVDEGLSSPTTTPSFAPTLSPTYPLALPLPAPLPPPAASLKASWKEPPLTVA